MLRITVEIVPFGQEDLARTLGIFTVANQKFFPETNTAHYHVRWADGTTWTVSKFDCSKGWEGLLLRTLQQGKKLGAIK